MPTPRTFFMAGSHGPEQTKHGKCMECLCGIQNDRGTWCVVLKRIPTTKEVKRCRRFCPKAILDDPEE